MCRYKRHTLREVDYTKPAAWCPPGRRKRRSNGCAVCRTAPLRGVGSHPRQLWRSLLLRGKVTLCALNLVEGGGLFQAFGLPPSGSTQAPLKRLRRLSNRAPAGRWLSSTPTLALFTTAWQSYTLRTKSGGGRWIRTTEAFASDLQSDPFGRSGIPPDFRLNSTARLKTGRVFSSLAALLSMLYCRWGKNTFKLELARGVEPPTG